MIYYFNSYNSFLKKTTKAYAWYVLETQGLLLKAKILILFFGKFEIEKFVVIINRDQ